MDYLVNFFNNNFFLSIYFLAINFVAFFIYGLDKVLARSQAWRVRERTLLILALLGGSIGAMLGIKIFRHKNRKIDFLFWLALILVLQVGAIIWLMQSYNTGSTTF